MSTLTSQTIMSDGQEAEQRFQPSDFSFLSQVLTILQKIEAGEDAQEIGRLSSNLKTSFKKCQNILDHLPGADLSPDEQEKILAEEMKILERKKAQLKTYLSWQVFQHDNPIESTLIKQDLSDHNDIHLSEPTSTSLSSSTVTAAAVATTSAEATPISVNSVEGMMKLDAMDDRSEGEHIKHESQEPVMPSLGTDTSFMSDLESSQGSYAQPPLRRETGLTFALSDIKMEDSQDFNL
ncbi:hypothetical protein BX616_005617 [Lobosporangium transversale]|uniref:Mediator of RNA polymerase II transcription subunit 9 n=1 Tax=Lobosporangium transversale TaxID=64571 RepID=A0A1Y2GNH9_9FUNG|nr:hypothetical protein BCR41DRAFT_396352 [Lobosporangium transversale]KAF9915689.1 hypothetical protein BX616_005617 [Lobosporangium transversale]ORZ15404.1 hypothetical protein BCR41DRAFT_396352 [Lobosporangium transversale]|eukprot:XP_021881152.1 hypothetical protein BCR41DRAFT_396352 [Lobosporangium transversale]